MDDATPQPPAPSGARRILIVEDDVDTAELLVQQLERDGWSIAKAHNGQRAILVTGELAPDLIVMDLMMPKLDGFETSRFFRAKFRREYIPILVLTAKDDPQSRARCARHDCDDYLTKPYNRRDLIASVELLLDVSQAENALRDVVDPPEPYVEYDAQGNVIPPPEPPTPEPGDVAALERAAAATHMTVAQHQLNTPNSELARVHLKRVLELDPDHADALNLLRTLDGA